MAQTQIGKLSQLKAQCGEGGINEVEEFLEAFSSAVFSELMSNNLAQENLDQINNWKAYVQWHQWLLKEVSEIHKKEESAVNAALAEAQISAKIFLADGEDGKRGHRLYCLKTIDGPVDVVGDLHSDPDSLMRVLVQSGFLEDLLRGRAHRMVFLGDYVDRGRGHLDMTGALLALKYLFKDHVFLLRGNHDGGILLDDGSVKLPYGKPEADPDTDYFPLYLLALGKAKPEAEPLLANYMDFWNTLAQMAFIESAGQVSVAVHGGVPRPLLEQGSYYGYLKSLSDLTDPHAVDPFGRTMVQNLMWSDPYRGSGDLREGMGRFYFTKEQAMDFLETIDGDRIFRGHEAVEEGFRPYFDDRLFTVFSSGNGSAEVDDGGAFLGQGKGKNLLTAYSFVKPKWARIVPSGFVSHWHIL